MHEQKEAATAPPAPFTASCLHRRPETLKFTPQKTIDLALKFYEAGDITYMRPDSPNLSNFSWR